MKSITPEEFFKRVATNSGVVDLKTVKDIYYGLIRTLSQELKGRQVITLPDWGEFILYIQKPKKFTAFLGKDLDGQWKKKESILNPIPQVKFRSNPNVKKYFQSLG